MRVAWECFRIGAIKAEPSDQLELEGLPCATDPEDEDTSGHTIRVEIHTESRLVMNRRRPVRQWLSDDSWLPVRTVYVPSRRAFHSYAFGRLVFPGCYKEHYGSLAITPMVIASKSRLYQ